MGSLGLTGPASASFLGSINQAMEKRYAMEQQERQAKLEEAKTRAQIGVQFAQAGVLDAQRTTALAKMAIEEKQEGRAAQLFDAQMKERGLDTEIKRANMEQTKAQTAKTNLDAQLSIDRFNEEIAAGREKQAELFLGKVLDTIADKNLEPNLKDASIQGFRDALETFGKVDEANGYAAMATRPAVRMNYVEESRATAAAGGQRALITVKSVVDRYLAAARSGVAPQKSAWIAGKAWRDQLQVTRDTAKEQYSAVEKALGDVASSMQSGDLAKLVSSREDLMSRLLSSVQGGGGFPPSIMERLGYGRDGRDPMRSLMDELNSLRGIEGEVSGIKTEVADAYAEFNATAGRLTGPEGTPIDEHATQVQAAYDRLSAATARATAQARRKLEIARAITHMQQALDTTASRVKIKINPGFRGDKPGETMTLQQVIDQAVVQTRADVKQRIPEFEAGSDLVPAAGRALFTQAVIGKIKATMRQAGQYEPWVLQALLWKYPAKVDHKIVKDEILRAGGLREGNPLWAAMEGLQTTARVQDATEQESMLKRNVKIKEQLAQERLASTIQPKPATEKEAAEVERKEIAAVQKALVAKSPAKPMLVRSVTGRAVESYPPESGGRNFPTWDAGKPDVTTGQDSMDYQITYPWEKRDTRVQPTAERSVTQVAQDAYASGVAAIRGMISPPDPALEASVAAGMGAEISASKLPAASRPAIGRSAPGRTGISTDDMLKRLRSRVFGRR